MIRNSADASGLLAGVLDGAVDQPQRTRPTLRLDAAPIAGEPASEVGSSFIILGKWSGGIELVH